MGFHTALFQLWEAGSNFDPVPDNELLGIVETLVKFEEIVLSDIDFKEGKQLLRAILTALPGEGSKLKMLTLIGPPMYEKELGAVLIEARGKGLTVKVESFFAKADVPVTVL